MLGKHHQHLKVVYLRFKCCSDNFARTSQLILRKRPKKARLVGEHEKIQMLSKHQQRLKYVSYTIEVEKGDTYR